ncbi:uncharacterized protein LY79DRAFT_666891 [Colletotrichum navitas]|uniref:Uncharacterized protein n=1 Tax=Colletotrichum navitas TaxID=681940 RepID=A0AAD8Q8W5_9PEZI|nr:uncharacterized protein LY79DRAFT_666891 [Colletotrichum navitas]KAK1597147.1 hypothetical protein LY79DRAFT_666891 [Colletotrichum navitas]
MKNSISQPPRGRLTQLVFFASAAAVASAAIISIGDTSLSLSNFQLIADLSVPLGCLLVYNLPLSGCETTDFDSRRTCSAQCTRGLAKKQSTLQQVCGSVQVQSNTVQHYEGCTAPDQHRLAAAAAAATTTTTTTNTAATSATGIFHSSRSTSAATDYNINTNTGPASPSATTTDYSTTAGKHPGTARTAAAASASGNN